MDKFLSMTVLRTIQDLKNNSLDNT